MLQFPLLPSVLCFFVSFRLSLYSSLSFCHLFPRAPQAHPEFGAKVRWGPLPPSGFREGPALARRPDSPTFQGSFLNVGAAQEDPTSARTQARGHVPLRRALQPVLPLSVLGEIVYSLGFSFPIQKRVWSSALEVKHTSLPAARLQRTVSGF